MTDHFAALAQTRRPWLEAGVLKEQFHRAAAAAHPDAAAGDAGRFAGIEEAYRVLRDPASRLRHLLELAAPGVSAGPGAILSSFADLFMEVASFESRAGALRKKEQAASGALARALLAPEKLVLQQRVAELQAALDALQTAAETDLRAFDAGWDSPPADFAATLAALQQRFAYLSRWRAQIAESAFHLAS